MEARLPHDKLQRILETLSTFLDKNTCTKRQLLSLLGHLNFAWRVVRPGRSFVSYLISLSTTVSELHHHVTITAECRLDMRIWYQFLSSWNGVAFFLDDNITTAADMHLFTDATDSAFGGYHNYCGKWFQDFFPMDMFNAEEKPSMAYFELYPIVMACVFWGQQWSRKRILFHSDNLATFEMTL